MHVIVTKYVICRLLITVLLRMILLYKDRYHTNQPMHHGRSPPKLASKNCKKFWLNAAEAFLRWFTNLLFLISVFGSYFRSQDPRRDSHSRPYLKWLFLLVQMMRLVSEPMPSPNAIRPNEWCTCSLRHNPRLLLDLTGNLDLWFIKWYYLHLSISISISAWLINK